MNIVIEKLPYSLMRYPSCGDWQYRAENDTLYISVADLGNSDYGLCVALHEMVEATLCLLHGVLEKDVDAFDLEFEKNREEGHTREAGMERDAPYHQQHFFATAVEMLYAQQLGVNWNEYESAINALSQTKQLDKE